MRRSFSALLILAMLNGCTHWATLQEPMDQVIRPEGGPERIRVRMRDGRDVELRSPTLDAVTVSGFSRRDPGLRITVPRDSTWAIQVRKVSALGTTALVVGGLVVVVGVVYGVAIATLWDEATKLPY